MNSIENIDVKKSINWLSNLDEIYEINEYNSLENKIIICNNFLSESECDEIIKNGEEHGMEYLEYRKSHRIIGIDSNNNLTKTIQTRLKQRNLINEINKFNCVPYGFESYNVEWNDNLETHINTCFRMNKYESSNFEIHRDAQLTFSKTIKSNYTILIYLNDDYEGGETIFQIHNDINVDDMDILYNGISAKKEAELTKNKSNFYTIKPTKGTCVIFDQRILHKSEKCEGIKYVLRTDLIRTGIIKKEKEQIKSEKIEKLENLTKCLFRQAQLNELNNITYDVDLYEICLNLRQYPHLLKEYPIDLEKYLKFDKCNFPICSELNFIGRSGCEYIFEYNTEISNKFELVKLCVLFSVYSLIKKIDVNYIEKFNNEIKNYGIKFNGINCDDIIKNEYLNSYYCDDKFKKNINYNFVEKLVENIKIDGNNWLTIHDYYDYCHCFFDPKDIADIEVDEEDKVKYENSYWDLICDDDDSEDEYLDDEEYENKKKQNRLAKKMKNHKFIDERIKKYKAYEIQSDIENKKKNKIYQEDNNINNVFDLTNTIKKNTYHSGTISNSYNIKNTDKKEEISIRKTFKDLFSIDMENYDIIKNDKINYKPMTTLATFDTADMEIYEEKYGCGSTCCQYDNLYVNKKNAIGIYNVEFKTQEGDNIVNLYDINFDNENNEITGLAKITTPVESFNHAACNCKYSEKKVLNSIGHQKYLTIDYSINFTIKKNNIILKIIPFVVL